MIHPVQLIPAPRWLPWFIVSTVVSWLFLVFLYCQGGELHTPQAPGGILSLQMALTADQATTVIQSWKNKRVIGIARNQELIDFGFLIVYPLAISLGWAWVASDWTVTSKKYALRISTIVLFAGLFDCIEDLGSLQMIDNKVTPLLAALVTCCAAIKFLIAVPALIVLLWFGIPKLTGILCAKLLRS